MRPGRHCDGGCHAYRYTTNGACRRACLLACIGAEVTAIDSAGFGPINITKAITITSPDGIEAGIVPSPKGNAITIGAGTNDAVVLRGLTLNGGGVGYNGVVFNSGGSLTVTNCVMQNFAYDGVSVFTGNGIMMQPSSGAVKFVITNTVASNNGLLGIAYFPTGGSPSANVVIDHVTVTGNFSSAIVINTLLTTGGATIFAVSNSSASNNSTGASGVFINGPNLSAPVTVSIDNFSAVGNGAGISVSGAASTVLLSRSVITGNEVGIDNGISTFYTYGNNQ